MSKPNAQQLFQIALSRALFDVQQSANADIFHYNNDLSNEAVDVVMEEVTDRPNRRPNLVLLLTTQGGNPHSAYRLARFLKRAYERLIICVFGPCKSAGTLVLFGADEIVTSEWGELGPLDVQVTKEDNLIFRSSGLDIEEAVTKIGSECQNLFSHFFLKIIEMGGGAITTKTASEISSSMAVGLLSPITEQIDPLKVGETNRQLRIVQEYAERLCGKATQQQKNAIAKLSSDYPSHGFVIDRLEAEELFGRCNPNEPNSRNTGKVRQPNEKEEQLERLVHFVAKESRSDVPMYLDPDPEPDLFDESSDNTEFTDSTQPSTNTPVEQKTEPAPSHDDSPNDGRNEPDEDSPTVDGGAAQTAVPKNGESGGA